MKLHTVTLTGADDSVRVGDLFQLSKEFPYVEWGILFSPKRQGNNRYPFREWLEALFREVKDGLVFPLFSAHLCGQWVVDLCNGDFSWERHYGSMSHQFARMQLNMTDDRYMTLDLKKLSETLAKNSLNHCDFGSHPKFILQTKRPFARADELAPYRFHLLYDVSGGKGVLPKSWAEPVKGVQCGMAGGLRPENLAEQLEAMEKVAWNHEIWVDMESGLRDKEDKFSLEKARKCLEIAKKWI